MRKKGLIGWLAFFFFLGVFVALFLFIFLYFFKYHVTMMMIDYYFWNKEYDIPLALLSTDIYNTNSEKYESSIVALNKIHYGFEKKDNYNLVEILEEWSKGVYRYTLTFGEFVLQNETKCTCKERDPRLKLYGICTGCKKETEGKFCYTQDYDGFPAGTVIEFEDHVAVPRPYTCWGLTKVTQMGTYPIPVVFNGTHLITELTFTVIG
ncbi:MAG: hypothetical protein QMD36_01365 [Candidatus Aenigmarchaeota archaeon]|nr:hypothetical protein [Candidatus Aenigmarchaeota archaeon]